MSNLYVCNWVSWDFPLELFDNGLYFKILNISHLA